ncbi:hypothetical protein NKI31_29845, partial [Mesorhizobium sp. M0659]|uniref:hypothetical protein n=1 Tax=Mesorhizobium sp. M0659 TaxID=2956980 RepID=UPI00333CAD1E
VSRQTIAGPPADKKTVTHAIGPFCYLSIRFGHELLSPRHYTGRWGAVREADEKPIAWLFE